MLTSIRRDALDLNAFEAWCEGLPAPELVYQDHPLATFLLLTSGGGCGYVNAKLLNYRVHEAAYSTGASNLARAKAIVRKGAATREATATLVSTFLQGCARACRSARRRARVRVPTCALLRREGHAMRKYLAGVASGWGAHQLLKEGARLSAVLGRAGRLLCYEVITDPYTCRRCPLRRRRQPSLVEGIQRFVSV